MSKVKAEDYDKLEEIAAKLIEACQSRDEFHTKYFASLIVRFFADRVVR